ncbi:Gfo/Idh/MocA family protein [Cohnella fermenti]|uniref:Gfo/Idh/MocA family oxidoreductase n=1 Tax=Cohnella fermenti TaxID=2565925 RepID=A0A4S4BQS9_9BACL|nr:Gfo/Idh/MocA family oxidoreductase [Cohnella fermenti]THF77315.1 Gfo/Idh/MocA family oxidoreductase [Cohnella fermenti]
MRELRLGIIGLGRFATLHARIWSQMPGVKVTALCDSDAARFPLFKELFPEAECYADWRQMLDSRTFDAVDVLTPEHLHDEPAIAALRAGAHVFAEKPIAHRPEAAARMIEAAENGGKVLMIGHVLRFDPRYAAVKTRLAESPYGRIRTIYAKRNNGSVFFPIYNRVNPVYILGIHDIDLMHWYMDDEVEEVYALRSAPGADGPPDVSWAMLTFRGGGIGILENNWLLPEGAPAPADVRMEISAERGAVTIIDPEPGVYYSNDRRTDVQGLLNDYVLHGKTGGALAAELSHFAECAMAGRPSEVLRPRDALRALQVAAAVERSAAEGRAVRLSESAGAP